MFQISDISLFAKLHFFQRINGDTYTFSSKWVKVFHNMSLDLLRETTYSYRFANKNLTQIWGIYKIYSKKDS